MERSYNCSDCGVTSITNNVRGPIPKFCPGCNHKRQIERMKIQNAKKKKRVEVLPIGN